MVWWRVQALRRDLRYMEQDASTFAAAVEGATDTVPTQAIQQLKGRFTFLWGMYKAHSEVRFYSSSVKGGISPTDCPSPLSTFLWGMYQVWL